ncbi:MAG: hypothetical protein KDC33_04005 [Thermoleophilia bacterium]|nr:hypothetical protein [Thermoleophilia bacterium]
MRTLLSLAAAALLAATIPTTASARSVFIASPTRNLGCQIVDNDARLRPSAYCQSYASRTSVTLSKDGRLRVCRRSMRCIGDGPPETRVLPYGRSRTVGRFRCTSRRDGMRCVIRASGKGFHIDRTRVRPVR